MARDASDWRWELQGTMIAERRAPMSAAPVKPLPLAHPKTAKSPCDGENRLAQPEISWSFVPRIQPGEYPAYSRSASHYFDRQYKRWVCAVQFDVLDGSLTEVRARLTWYLNLGSKDKPRAGRRGNYWAAWVRANGASPKRRDRLSLRVFQRRYARVLVEDTTKNHSENHIAAEDAYSVIREVVRWETGGPPR